MIRRSKKKETLSDKISGILSTAPISFDPEDDIYVETTAKVAENDVESEGDDNVGLSKFRKQTAELLEEVDVRYVGKKGSRKSLKDSDEDWSTEDEGLSTDEGEALDGVEGSQEIPSDEHDDSDGEETEENVEDESESDYSDEGLLDDTIKDEKEATELKFKHMSDSNSSAHAKKGNSVRNQLNMWESLLEIRIQLQKCLVQSNKLPQHEVFKSFGSDEKFKTEYTKSKKTMKNMLDKFLTLQLLLLKQYSETKTLLTDKKNKNKEEKVEDDDQEIPSDTEDEKSEDSEEEAIPKKRPKISDIEHQIKTRHDKYRNYRNDVIQKWNDKTRFNIAKNNTQVNSVIQHINFILEDKQKLVKRTQLKRSEYEILGKVKGDEKTEEPSEKAPQEQSSKSPEEYDTEIFDDDDFYHQLLRELIEFKSAGITDPIQISRQWIQLQNLRSKMKRKIDTRATKGRKIRYAIHSKLVNYMAPMDYCTMTQEARNELYSSLFK